MSEKPLGTLKRNERQVIFTCEKCITKFNQKYCEYWQWVYSGGGILLDEKGNPVYDDNGRVIIKRYEWELKPGGAFRTGHTSYVICPICGHMEKINLNKKKFRFLKSAPPTENEVLEEA